jgi:23S rRNA (guanosine2251-2'-O)-methyltransferase
MRQLRDTDIKRLMRAYRREHPLKHEIVVICQSIEYPMNVGSIFRVADALDLQELTLTGITPTPPNATISKVARGKEERVPWRYLRTADEAIADYREQGYHICAIEITDSATPFIEFHYPSKICLIVGHEDHGVTNQTLSLCDSSVYLPMFGKGRSLNVHVSLGIVCAFLRFGLVPGA